MQYKLRSTIINLVKYLLPNKLFNFIAFIKGFFYFKISYSQFGEDLIIENYLNSKNIKKGKYLDIGAFHPRWISNTHLLHKRGFKGYCVDIDYEKLKWIKFDRGNKVKIIFGAVSSKKKNILIFINLKIEHLFSNRYH